MILGIFGFFVPWSWQTKAAFRQQAKETKRKMATRVNIGFKYLQILAMEYQCHVPSATICVIVCNQPKSLFTVQYYAVA